MKYSGHNNITFFHHYYWLFLPTLCDIVLNPVETSKLGRVPQQSKVKAPLGWEAGKMQSHSGLWTRIGFLISA